MDDPAARKALFARNVMESHEVMALLRAELRANASTISNSRIAIAESRALLAQLAFDG